MADTESSERHKPGLFWFARQQEVQRVEQGPCAPGGPLAWLKFSLKQSPRQGLKNKGGGKEQQWWGPDHEQAGPPSPPAGRFPAALLAQLTSQDLFLAGVHPGFRALRGLP